MSSLTKLKVAFSLIKDNLQATLNLKNSVVLIGSNSGSTHSCLALSNLLQAFTENIFVISSEFDTEVI